MLPCPAVFQPRANFQVGSQISGRACAARHKKRGSSRGGKYLAAGHERTVSLFSSTPHPCLSCATDASAVSAHSLSRSAWTSWPLLVHISFFRKNGALQSSRRTCLHFIGLPLEEETRVILGEMSGCQLRGGRDSGARRQQRQMRPCSEISPDGEIRRQGRRRGRFVLVPDPDVAAIATIAAPRRRRCRERGQHEKKRQQKLAPF